VAAAALLALSAVAATPTPAPAKVVPAGPRVVLALLPPATPLEAVASTPGLTVGLMSAGLGSIEPPQTYLDITQGARIWRSLYPRPLPVLTVGPEVRGWGRVQSRAREAPADLAPGLLAGSIQDSGLPVGVQRGTGLGGLVAANRLGRTYATQKTCGGLGCVAGLLVRSARARDLVTLASRLRSDDLLVAFPRPVPGGPRLLPIALAGSGFGEGVATSDSTRLAGLVLSTDLGPTVLRRLALPVPSQMDGEPLRATGDRQPADLPALERRLAEIAPRRGSVIRDAVVVWLALVAAGWALLGRRVGLRGLAVAALAACCLPALLLVSAGLDPSLTVERLVVGLGAPAVAALTLALVGGGLALAVVCSVSVLAYAVDVIAGSHLTALSLMGPNPSLGARFYGIGNELEACLSVLLLVGVGAALAAAHCGGRRATAWFLGSAAAGAFVFAAGGFGADVGAAIVIPVGAAAAALTVIGPRRRGLAIAMVLAAPLAALALLAMLDLLLGGDSHLTRSVLRAGGLDGLADVAERRLRLSARSFTRPSNLLALAGLLALGLAAWAGRGRVAAWLQGPAAWRAGFLGAAAAVGVGTLANDSGALVLVIGAGFLVACLAYAGTTQDQEASKTEPG
jgi:hypothetical protein